MAKKKNNLKLLLLASYVNNLGWGIYAPLYGIFVLKLGGDSFSVSLIWGIYALVTGLLIMLFGRIENNRRYNPALMLLIGYGLFIFIPLGFLMVRTVQEFFVVQMLLAIAMGILTPAVKVTFARAERKGQELSQWGLLDGGNYILGAVAAVSGGILYRYGGFTSLFVAMTTIQLFATGAAYRNLRSTRQFQKSLSTARTIHN